MNFSSSTRKEDRLSDFGQQGLVDVEDKEKDKPILGWLGEEKWLGHSGTYFPNSHYRSASS